MVFSYTNKYITPWIVIFNLVYFSEALKEETVIETRRISTNLIDKQELGNAEPEEKWLENALKDVAYHLRNHKFNEWDRRYYKNISIYPGFYDAFPSPTLKSIHWEVHKNCHENFFKCITYLHRTLETAPFTRSDDITTSLNKNKRPINIRALQNRNNDCKKALSYMEKTGLPFGGPKEKFYWRTSASYYMCWYTMIGIPALSMLGESCDNFASCLDETFGNRNRDPRSDDKLSFACAMYSFCPDPCCPLKHIKHMSDCYDSINNPCHVENANNDDTVFRRCSFERKDNQNLEEMMLNRWNISCPCQQKGFTWNSQFGMCVDINECSTTKQHKCDTKSESCLNLPGSYQCVCKWGYSYDRVQNKCIQKMFLTDSKETNLIVNFKEKVGRLLNFIMS